MALIKPLQGITPTFGDNCFLAETAVIIGDVIMGNHCSVWYGAVIRGDVHHVRIGNLVNIQDNAVIHATYQKSPTHIGNQVSIAHSAIIHGCTIHDRVLIGMGAIIMDDAVVESDCIIAAGAVVTKGTVVPSGSVFAGNPAKLLKTIDRQLLEGEVHRIAESYRRYASWYQ
ncbi:MAG TPA: gamma carbonic anhydrase family protein [Bacteroidales bacterium]|nr:gamma carbonic anhydrase family protein [Bacteroidales bacterium]HRZ48494.1 gamma carbonic anhydrase family protein [Bacteroidales bacterium]